MPVRVEVFDDVFGSEYPHPLLHINQAESRASIGLGRGGIYRVDQSENVGIIIAAISGTKHPVPAIMLPLFNTSRGRIDLEPRLRVRNQAIGIIKLEGALDLEQFTIVVVGRPFADKAPSWLDDGFEGRLT